MAGCRQCNGLRFPPGSFGLQWARTALDYYLKQFQLLRNLFRLKLAEATPRRSRISHPAGSSTTTTRRTEPVDVSSRNIEYGNMWTADATARSPQAVTEFETGVGSGLTWTET